MLDITKKLPTDYERLTLSGKNYLPGVPMPKNGDGWTSKARTVTIGLTKKVPYVGSILSFVIQSFWTEGKADIWSQISDNVGKMIDLKILEFEINRDGAELAAIKADMMSYVMAKNNSEKATKLTILISTCNEM